MYADAIINIVNNFILFSIVVAINYKIKCRYWIKFDKKGTSLFSIGVVLAVILFSLIGLWICIDKTYYLKINLSNIVNSTLLLILFGFGYLGVAFFEEALFRGFILCKLLKKLPIPIAIIIQAIIFTSLHLFNYKNQENLWIKMLTAFIIAIIFAITTIRTKSLMIAIGAHFALDLCSKLLVSADKNRFNWLIHFEQNKITSSYGHIIIGTDYKILIILTITLFLVIVFVENPLKLQEKKLLEGKSSVHI